ncbi:MAG: hypothetical protein KA369_21755 [Spirochaetes bacterium]|nr:hypothetical protein [Spirochaetota bacterium]
MSIKKKFGDIIRFITRRCDGVPAIGGMNAAGSFNPPDADDLSLARTMTACFLAVLSGADAPGHGEALQYLEGMKGAGREEASRFFLEGAALALREVETSYRENDRFRRAFEDLHEAISGGPPGDDILRDLVWGAFFPEGVINDDRSAAIAALREKRTVRITGLNQDPIRFPEREILFTANALLTVPSSPEHLEAIDADLREAIEETMKEEQLYWYDHPIPVGTPAERNELVYGLRRLSEAMDYEESAGLKDPEHDIDCVISVSVTHRGLRDTARPWLASLLDGAEGARGVNLHVFTEEDTARLLEDILLPAARQYDPASDGALLREVFGVDGEYGRHYNFLKAIARFWSVFVSPEIRAAFKIDLDQAFPQEELARETGMSAFGHLRTSLWGARGRDSAGDEVYLGMIAGTLVNRKDIAASVFTPDVPVPDRGPCWDEAVFWSAVPQALSTEAEMMARYGAGQGHDGRTSCLQRVHVTGGTTGILVEALRRYRPFTLSRIGRAEDQAYLLSVLYRRESGAYLRYCHGSGLVMRHDSDLFADTADAARTGKILGDYVRTMLFSDYARALPWGCDRMKSAVDPFTGCFISALPITIVCLRFALRAARMIAENDPESLRFFTEGIGRLSVFLDNHRKGKNPIEDMYMKEKQGWDLYYDTLDCVERDIKRKDPFAMVLLDKARVFVESVKIKK